MGSDPPQTAGPGSPEVRSFELQRGKNGPELELDDVCEVSTGADMNPILVMPAGTSPDRHESSQGLKLRPTSNVLSAGSCSVGPFFHVMLSYRVATEGDGGNTFTMQLYKELHAVSMQRAFCLPVGLEGEWPKWARPPPEEFLEGSIKVYFDAMCLEDGEPWEAGSTGMGGFIGGVSSSIIMVPLLSWYDGDTGSVGGLKNLKPPEVDYVDNVLLELIVALELRGSTVGRGATRLKRIMPILMGAKDSGGRYGDFPFSKVTELSDNPSTATNAKASSILSRLGVVPSDEIMTRSVKGVVNEILAFDGLQLSSEGTHSKALRAVAERIVTEARAEVLACLDDFEEATRELEKFAVGTPQGAEVLAWLAKINCFELAEVFAAEGVDSLRIIANMTREDIAYFLAGGKEKKTIIRRSSLIEFNQAVLELRNDLLSQKISERLWMHQEGSASLGVAFFNKNGVEQSLSTTRNTQFVLGSSISGLISFACMFLVEGDSGRAFLSLKDWPYSDGWHILSTVWYLTAIAVFVLYRDAVKKTPKMLSPIISGQVQMFLVHIYALLHFPGLIIQNTLEPASWEVSPFRAMRWWTYWALHIPFYFMVRFQGPFFWVGGILSVLTVSLVTAISITYEVKYKNPAVEMTYWFVVCSVITNGAIWIGAMQLSLYKAHKQLTRASHIYQSMWEEFWGRNENLEQARKLAQLTRVDAEELEKEKAMLTAEDSKIWSLDKVAIWQWLLIFDFWMDKYRKSINYSMRISKMGKILQQTHDIDLLFDHAREVHWYFQEWVSSWDPEVQQIPGPVKNPARALQKCVRQYAREVRCLTDLVRCTVIAKDVEGALRFYQEVKRRCVPLGQTIEGGCAQAMQMSKRQRAARVHAQATPENDTQSGVKGVKYEVRPRLLRLTKIKNRLDPDYDATESLGFRALALGLEVCWVRRERGLTFLPVDQWGTEGSKRHICEIQVLVEGAAHINQVDHELYQYYRDWRDLMFK